MDRRRPVCTSGPGFLVIAHNVDPFSGRRTGGGGQTGGNYIAFFATEHVFDRAAYDIVILLGHKGMST